MRSARLIVRGVVAAVAAFVVAVCGVPAATLAAPAAASVEPEEGDLWGYVNKADGAGRFGAGEVIMVAIGPYPGTATTQAETDADGRYVFLDLVPGQYRLRADPQISAYQSTMWTGGQTNRVTVPTTGVVDMWVANNGKVSGRISLGAPGVWAGAGDVRVTITRCELDAYRLDAFRCVPDPYETWTVLTSADGAYFVEGMDYGYFTVKFDYLGTGNYTSLDDDRRYDYRMNRTTGFDYRDQDVVIPEGAIIEGVVTLDGGPVGPGDVELSISSSASRTVVVPDASGHFSFDRVVGGGTATVTATYLGDADFLSGRFTAFDVVAGGTTLLNIDLSPGARVSGRLLDSSGAPRDGYLALWMWKEVSEGQHQFVNVTGYERVASDGSWSFASMQPGLYQMRTASQTSGGDGVSYPAVTWRDPLTGEDSFDLVPNEHLTVDLTVYRAARVTMSTSCGGCATLPVYISTFRRNEVTDAWMYVPSVEYRPTFPVEMLLPGDYRFTAHPGVGGYAEWVSPVVTVTEAETIDLGRMVFSRIDMLVRQSDGSLYSYPSDGGRLGERVKVGSGYSAYTKILEVGDVDGDGASDLFVVDKSGRLFLRAGEPPVPVAPRFTRSSSQPVVAGFAPAVLISAGWGEYRWLGAAGDVDGDGYPDLVAQTGSGRVYLIRSDRDGGFLPRELISSWESLSGFKILGFDPGRGFIARSSSGTTSTFSVDFSQTGDSATATLAPRRTLTSKWKDVMQVVAITSFDNDGYTDYIVRTNAGKIVRWDSNEYGNLVDPVTLATGWSGRLLI